MKPFSISCTTCGARLKVRDERAIGQLSLCPKCSSMVMITPPSPAGSPVGPVEDSPRQGPRPGDSSQQMIVGGGMLGSNFDDAAALLADTMPEMPAPAAESTTQLNTPASTEQSTLATTPLGKDAAPTENAAPSQKAASLATPTELTDNSPQSPPVAHEPPPLEPPTESMSSIELDPRGSATLDSHLSEPPSATRQQAAAIAVPLGAAMPPPVAAPQPVWLSPTQQLWQRWGLLSVAVIAAVVLVGGLLAFVLSGPKKKPVAETPAEPEQVDPIPDLVARAGVVPELNPSPLVPPPKDVEDPSATDPTVEANVGVPPEEAPPAVPPVVEPPEAAPPVEAPPLFVGSDPVTPEEDSTSEPTADTGLGDLAPLIDAFPLPPVAPKNSAKPDERSDGPAPVPTATASRPRPDPVNVNLSARLADKIDGFDGGGAPLVKFVELMTQLSTIPITLDPQALAQTKTRPDAPVSVTLTDTSVGNILQKTLAEYKLAMEVRDDQIVVVPAQREIGKLLQVAHAVDDLAATEAELTALSQHVERLVAPESWEAAGGEGTITLEADTIRVRNALDVQFNAHVFFQKLRVARGLPTRSKFKAEMFQLRSRTTQAQAKLDTPVRAVFHVERPLAKILGHLEDTADVTFLIDWQSLLDVGWPPHSSATVVADGRPLTEALDELLGPMDLTYAVVDDSTLQIVSQKTLITRPELEFYAVEKVLVAKGVTPAQLIGQIRDEIGPGLFAAGGGPFEMRYEVSSQCLLVRLPQAQQRVLEALIDRWVKE